MKSNAEIKAELDKLMLELTLIMDRPVNSPEVKKWTEKALEVKAAFSRIKH